MSGIDAGGMAETESDHFPDEAACLPETVPIPSVFDLKDHDHQYGRYHDRLGQYRQ
jgi:hypothetical protein